MGRGPRPVVWEQAAWRPADIAWAMAPLFVLVIASELLGAAAPSTLVLIARIALFGAAYAWLFFCPIRLLRRRAGGPVGLGIRAPVVRELLLAIPIFVLFLLMLGGVARGIEAITGGPIRPAAESRAIVHTMQTSRIWMWIHGAIACALAPWAEEIFFRGFLYHALRKRWGWPLAALGQALAFTGLHYRYELGMLVMVFACGLALLAIYRWRRTLLSPILIHTAFNALVFVGLVSDSQRPQPQLGVLHDVEAKDCRLAEVVPGSAAAEAGLKAGDVVISFNGEPVESFLDLQNAVHRCSVGDRVVIEWRRGDRTHTGRATLGERRRE